MLGRLLLKLLKKLAKEGSQASPASELIDFGYLKLRRCLYGWMLFAGPYIGKCFELYGEYSESEVQILRKYLKAGDFVVDVGANIGDLTLPMAQIVGQQGRVFAVESHPDVYNILCANLALNQIINVKPINHFIADRPDVDTASPAWGKYAYTGETWATSFMALDDLQLPRCNLIKVDVDGKELEVLRSARNTIKAYKPILYFENDVQEKSRELLAFVFSLGYRLFKHSAPIFRKDNFLGNAVNAWSPNSVCSLMVLALPSQSNDVPNELPEITDANFWWV